MSDSKWLLTGSAAVIIAAVVWYSVPAKEQTVSGTGMPTAERVAEIGFDAFQDKVFWDERKSRPQTLSRLRHFEAQGITDHNGRLDDISVAKRKSDLETIKKNLTVLEAYDDASLSEDRRFNKVLMAHGMKERVQDERFLFHDYPLTQLYGWQNTIPDFMTGTHSLTDASEVQYYIDRLYAVRAQYKQLKEQLQLREELGIIPPTFILEKVIKQLDGFVTKDPKANALYKGLLVKLEKLDEISDADKLMFLSKTEAAILSEIYPIWADLRAYVAALAAKSTADAGAWKLPDGKAYYQSRLEHFTTTTMTAAEIHALGLAEVARIQGEMQALFEAEGYDTTQSFPDLINGFAAEEKHYYPDTDDGRAQILADYTEMVAEISAGIADQFNRTPKAPVEVVRIPVFIEQGAPGGYYNRPALDGSRPGRFFANLYDIKGTPKYGMRALTYHEAVPGHHYQIALQQEQDDLPWFRKFMSYTAYVEGWALYSERVALEMGFQKTNFDKIGALQSELFRAVRLVVDTGMHDQKWTREQAISYMADNTGLAMSDVVTEIERYIVWPGQATGYKIGQLTILRLRDEARAALDDRFDIREFHDLVLSGGAVPLTILEDQIKAYIAQK